MATIYVVNKSGGLYDDQSVPVCARYSKDAADELIVELTAADDYLRELERLVSNHMQMWQNPVPSIAYVKIPYPKWPSPSGDDLITHHKWLRHQRKDVDLQNRVHNEQYTVNQTQRYEAEKTERFSFLRSVSSLNTDQLLEISEPSWNAPWSDVSYHIEELEIE